MHMATAFMKNGMRYTPVQAADNVGKLPPANFVIKIDPEDGHFYFEEVEPFRIPGQLYGDLKKQASRILTTFEARQGATGALLSGDPGSGKTLLAKLISVECAEKGMPTIVVDRAFGGNKAEPGTNPIDRFYKLLQDVQQPAVVFFDEFEKTHTKDQQEAMLTLLDGVFQGRKLWLLTCNDEYAIDTHMLNRPGRLFYHLGFDGMPAGAIREYCQENLKQQEHADKIVQMAGFFESFNFDMVQALVEEMNRYNEDPFEAVKLLNIRPRRGSANYLITLAIAGQQIPGDKFHPRKLEGVPVGRDINLKYYKAAISADESGFMLFDDDDENGKPIAWKTIQIRPQHLKRADGDSGTYEFQVGDAAVTFTREEDPPFSYKTYIRM